MNRSCPPADTALPTAGSCPISDANRLGIDYRAEAERLPFAGPILDVHTHLTTLDSARLYFEVAELFGVTKAWSMTSLERTAALREAFGERIEFIAVPNFADRDENPDTFTTEWLRRIELFREQGCRIVKFWAAPRGRDLHEDALHLDSPIRLEGMKLAHDLGYRVFMTHVGDPDTWFATKYADRARYLAKREHFDRLERLLEQYRDITWIGAHMGGYPEDLDYLQGILDRHPNYVVDTSATKWMVRELSKQPDALRAFCRQNPGRVLFGTDLVTNDENIDFDHYASRFWALRTLMETSYDGPSPIVDPDLHMVDPAVPEKSTARLRGSAMPDDLLKQVYHDATDAVFRGAP